MIFQSSNYDDIQRYYRKTFVKFVEMGERLFYITHVDSTVVTGVDEDGTDFELFLSDEHPYEVDFALPHKSFFQFGKYAVLLSRHPAKQYQRGLCEGNTQVIGLDSGGAVKKFSIGFDILKSYVAKQNFASLDEAITNKDRKNSTVLSPRFVYVPRTKTIYLDVVPVATVDTKTKQIRCHTPLFQPELKEIAKGSHFSEVVV